MGNLMNTIPIVKPPLLPVADKNNKLSPTSIVGETIPQVMTYGYTPAEPLSPARTIPKGVRAQGASGRLIKENLLQSAGSTVKSYAQISKHFLNAAFNGEVDAEGSDYYVGKVNDLAIRAGSLGIATILATSKLFPFAKGMEFIGLGTWFASMALWPRIIGAPIKWKTGVDINQKYEDSFGRRKFVYDDNQYRPMDLFRHVDESGRGLSEKEYYKKYKKDYVYLDKLGDKLGIPKNIKNRNEATMNKSGQVATQGRSLWMLTAGVMTPVLSSVIADSLQSPFRELVEKTRVYNATEKIKVLDKELDNLLDISSEYGSRRINTNLDEIIQKLGLHISEERQAEFEKLLGNKDFITDSEGLKKLQNYFEKHYRGTGFYDAIEKSMKHDFSHEEPMINFTDNLYSEIKQLSSDSVKKALAKMNPQFVETLPESVRNYSGISTQDFEEIKNIAKINQNEALNTLKRNSLENVYGRILTQQFNALDIDEDAVKMIQDELNKGFEKYLDTKKYHPLNADKLKKLMKFAEVNVQLQNKLEHFQKATIMNVAESITANNWEKLPTKYLEALNFTQQELAEFATINPSEASKILSAKLDKIVADKKAFETVLKKMTKLASTAITKEEKAVIQLIGTADDPGTLSKVKDLMTEVARANIGNTLTDSITMIYKSSIFDVQKKLRNTTDSFIRPIKALDTFKNLEANILKILGETEEIFKQRVGSNPSYHMFEQLTYEEAKKAFTEYLKDIVLDKNDINNWTTKFEHDIPGTKRGLKYSLEMVKHVADIVNGDVSEATAEIIGKNFAKKCNINNTIMRYRFLKLEYRLAKDYSTGGCYMQVPNPAEQLIRDICARKFEKLPIFEALIDERKAEITLQQIARLKEIRKAARDGFDYKILNEGQFYDEVIKALDFGTSNKSISEMAGKNVTDFFVNAAQNLRARNKWMKLAYGLLIGTTAISAFAIANIGKKNYFNKDKYEYKKTPQGVSK